MRFLVDEDLPRSVDRLLEEYGHQAVDVRDIGLRGASDSEVARYAQKEKLCLLSGDTGFCDIRQYPPANYAGLVVIRIPGGGTAHLIGQLVEGFLKKPDLVAKAPGKLAIVEAGRVRFRREVRPPS